MSEQFLSNMSHLVMDEIRERSKVAVYQTDFRAWKSDVLGLRTYDKMADIMDEMLFGEKNRTAIKSSNGTSKSWEMALASMWWATVFPPDETLAILSAPTVSQIEKTLIGYIKKFYGIAATRGFRPIGEINESLEWKYVMPSGQKGILLFGKRPSDTDIVSSFQGTRKLRTGVFIDEGGGVPADLFTAAEAVATGKYARVGVIGNPDRRGTEFHRIFTDDKYSQDWNRFSISSYELPTFTGEIVYDDPDMQEKMLDGLTQVDWVEQKRRVWGEGSARWLAKVLGEFPGEDDNTFFPQGVYDKAVDLEITDSESPVFLGCDIARYGQDESVVYLNQGGRIRFVEAWSKTDFVTTARKIHQLAIELGASEVRVDATGAGAGVFDNLIMMDEFSSKRYELYGIVGSHSSPDSTVWSRARSWHYDQFREGMSLGKVDIDYEDDKLRDEILSQTYRFNQMSALQISTKDEMRKAGIGSPDRLDAAIYSYVDLGFLNGPQPGDRLEVNLNSFVPESNPFYSYSW